MTIIERLGVLRHRLRHHDAPTGLGPMTRVTIVTIMVMMVLPRKMMATSRNYDDCRYYDP